MENLTIFENKTFGNVRVVEINNEPWFVAKDVCKCLSVNNSSQALSRLDNDEKGVILNDTLGGAQEMAIVNECGLYSLILSSRKPEAKEFKRWVTHEVIPTIRKHGAYMTPEVIEKTLTSPDFIIKLATKLKEEQEERQRLQGILDDARPKLDYYNHVADSDELFSPTVIGKSYGMTATQLNKYLHDKEIQYKVGSTWCLYRKYQDMGLVKMVTKTTIRNGFPATYTTMRWTHKGRVFINNLLISDGYVNVGLVS